MFLVELESGEQCLYRSPRALSTAIRRHELGPQARIFHRTTNRWLSITVHPEYRKVETEREERITRKLRGRRWTFYPESRVDRGPVLAPPPQQRPMTLLVPGDSESSGLAARLRRLLPWSSPAPDQ